MVAQVLLASDAIKPAAIDREQGAGLCRAGDEGLRCKAGERYVGWNESPKRLLERSTHARTGSIEQARVRRQAGLGVSGGVRPIDSATVD